MRPVDYSSRPAVIFVSTSLSTPFPPYVDPSPSASPAPGMPSRTADFAVPEAYAPPSRVVPDFAPIRVGRRGARRLLPPTPQLRRGSLALGVVVSAAVLAVSAGYRPPPGGTAAVRSAPSASAAVRPVHDRAEDVVKAPVRIADAAAVRLLRPGDRVDVLAAARVVASAVTVVAVPGQPAGSPAGTNPAGTSPAGIPEGALPTGTADTGGTGGALVVLAVPRRVAAALSGAAATSALAVTLC